MAYVTDTDAVDATMNGTGGDAGGVPKPIINLLKKRNQAGQVSPAQPNLNVQAGAGADGTANGSTNASGVRSSQPVIQDTDTQPSSTLGMAVGPQPENFPSSKAISHLTKFPTPQTPTIQAPNVINANPERPETVEHSSGSMLSDVLNGTEDTPTKPQLAQQGSKNPIIRAVQKATGFVKDSPAPGEKYTAPVTDEEKSQHMERLGVMLRGVQQAFQGLQSATGDKEQQARGQMLPIEEQKAENENLQLKSNLAYRRGQLGLGQQRIDVSQQRADQGQQNVDINQQKADTGQQRAGTAQSAAEVSARSKGQIIQKDGSVRPMTADEILQDPTLSQNQNLKAASIDQKEAERALAQAHQDAIMNPNNPTFAQREREIQSRLALAKLNLDARIKGLNMAGQRDEFNLGVNTMTGQRLENDPNAPAGMVANPSGAPTPYRQQGMYAPTSQEKNVGAQAKIVSDNIPNVIKDIIANVDQMGVLQGRWNEFATGRIGAPNPAFAGLQTTLVMAASAVALAHARGRLPENLRQEFDRMINAPQQDPQNVIAVLQAIQPWMQGMSEMGNVPQAEQPSGKASPTPAPKSPVHKATTSSQKSPFDK